MAKLDLAKLKSMVSNAADLTSAAREDSERDRDYYDEHQWTEEEKRILRDRRQPIITINRIKRKVDAMVGLEQRMRVDPKAYPRNPGDEEMAEAATKALVFVDDNVRFDSKRSAAFENAIVEGYGGVEVIVEEKRGRFEVVINRLRWEEIFFDPHSREKDFSDAAYIGTQKWMSLDAAVEMFEDSYEGKEPLEDILATSLTTPQDGSTYEDRPEDSQSFRWADRRYKRVRVAQMYYKRGGKWYLAVFAGGGVILNDLSPYEDEDGKPTNPIELMTAYVDRENRRYGVVRSMISQQDEINKRRSKLLHQLNSRQTMGVRGAVDSVTDLKRELAAPDGHVEINSEAFEDAIRSGIRPLEIVQTQDQTSGQFSLLQEAKSEIDMLGPNPSLIGQTDASASGRAIQAQQQAGMAELAPLYDALRDWTIRVYRAIWARIRQYWTEERWVRVADVTGKQEFVGLNIQKGVAPQVDQRTGQIVMAPQVENAVAEMDVDIIIEDTPDHVTLQQEQFQQLSELAKQGIPIPPEMLIKASSITDKSELLEMMKEQQQQQQQLQMQKLQQEMQIEQMKAQASAQKDSTDAAKNIAEVDKVRSETVENAADAFKTKVEAFRILNPAAGVTGGSSRGT